MAHLVITIGCEYGAKGNRIGRKVASDLGIKFYDRDTVDEIIKEVGIPKDIMEKVEQGVTIAGKGAEGDTRGAFSKYADLTERAIHVQKTIIRKLAARESCVIIGRSADYILKEQKPILAVAVISPFYLIGFDVIPQAAEEINVSTKKIGRMLLLPEWGMVAAWSLLGGVFFAVCKSRYKESFGSMVQLISDEDAAAAYKASGADFIVAFGGGSPMDVAKTVGVVVKYGGKIEEYEGAHKVPGKIVPLIAIPTTAGTGSEVTAFSVITDRKAL